MNPQHQYPSNYIDLSGQRFGRLIVVGNFGHRTKQGEVLWTCKCDCGNQTLGRTHSLRASKKLSCGCFARDVATELAWKGGRRTDGKRGYIRIYSPNHPKACNKWVYEHVLVMEKILGRYLTDGEMVHHINGNKGDNGPENLMLFASKREHVKHHTELRKRAALIDKGQKFCPVCSAIKPEDNFFNNKSRPDGKDWLCKDCYAKRYNKSNHRRVESNLSESPNS